MVSISKSDDVTSQGYWKETGGKAHAREQVANIVSIPVDSDHKKLDRPAGMQKTIRAKAYLSIRRESQICNPYACLTIGNDSGAT